MATAPSSAPRRRLVAPLLRLALLLAACARASSLAPPLRRALKVAKPLVVELFVEEPDEAWELDVRELSERVRTAGASALVAPKSLLATLATEQTSAKGNFPGPLPVLCEVDAAGWQVSLNAAREFNAAGIAVRCEDVGKAEALQELLEATAAADFESLVVVGARELVPIAQACGATAIACDYADASAADASAKEGDSSSGSGSSSTTTGSIMLGAWDGEDAPLARLRADGFVGMVLLDAVGGQVADGAAYCEARCRSFRSKASKDWGGSMFASTNADSAPPSAVNPRMWAQSQRQAREIMHESARSRGLPPPKIKRNPVL